MTLPELLDLLRTKGVTSFSGSLDGKPVCVSFGPVEVKAPRSVPFGNVEVEDCACGHPKYNHNPLCVEGCDPEKCIPVKERR